MRNEGAEAENTDVSFHNRGASRNASLGNLIIVKTHNALTQTKVTHHTRWHNLISPHFSIDIYIFIAKNIIIWYMTVFEKVYC